MMPIDDLNKNRVNDRKLRRRTFKAMMLNEEIIQPTAESPMFRR